MVSVGIAITSLSTEAILSEDDGMQTLEIMMRCGQRSYRIIIRLESSIGLGHKMLDSARPATAYALRVSRRLEGIILIDREGVFAASGYQKRPAPAGQLTRVLGGGWFGRERLAY
jgi:hypothetical protein